MTLKSMTAYARSLIDRPEGRFTVEIQSLNRRHLELQIFLPRELSRFEVEIRKLVMPKVARGQVTVKVMASFSNISPTSVRLNTPLALQLKAACEAMAKESGLANNLSIEALLKIQGMIVFEEDISLEGAYHVALEDALNEALAQFESMRGREGSALQSDILKRLDVIQEALPLIEKKAPETVERLRQKLTTRLKELWEGGAELQEKVLREVAVFAEKVDITEEIVRFRSHLDQAFQLIETSVESVGKTLEFILQELNREINTIGSKAADIEISKSVIAVKSELERIREQIQNVE